MKFLILALSICGIAVFGKVRDREKRPLYFTPPNILQHFSLGYKDFIANLLWLRFIQSADFCSFEKGKPVYTGDKKDCELGWSYNMVSAITDLAPRFKTPYKLSSLILSIFTGDKKGAEKILLKGLKHFPEDWPINFYATYLYAVELKKPKLAARYAYQAAKNGGPYWLYSLSAKQYGETGIKEHKRLGEQILTDLLNKNLTKGQKKHVKRHLQDFREKYMKQPVKNN